MFRHTYCAARLQTADRIVRTRPDGTDEVQWVPVSPFTVARELGHGGRALVDRVYGHVAELGLDHDEAIPLKGGDISRRRFARGFGHW